MWLTFIRDQSVKCETTTVFTYNLSKQEWKEFYWLFMTEGLCFRDSFTYASFVLRTSLNPCTIYLCYRINRWVIKRLFKFCQNSTVKLIYVPCFKVMLPAILLSGLYYSFFKSLNVYFNNDLELTFIVTKRLISLFSINKKYWFWYSWLTVFITF